MSTLSAPTSVARPAPVTAATILLALDALRNLASIQGLLSGAGIPAPIVAIQAAIGVVEIVAAAGLWRQSKRGAALAAVAAILSLLISVAGSLSAASAAGKVVSVIGLILGAVVVVLIALPAARRTYV